MPWTPLLEEQGGESQEVKKWIQERCPVEDMYPEEDMPHVEDSSKEEDRDQVTCRGI